MQEEHIPRSWVGRRVHVITVPTTDRTSHEEALLLGLDELGITLRRQQAARSDDEEVVFHPWAHVYQLGPLVK